ncbi:ABC transporter permease [Dyadobacter pollutisoli]|uniref:ABC transporter permease n=1 Tax=Dyadobacter pollutisoli TaxID=2910158 RepID=A0A9E8NAZ6_9BACT|nr:ABC transporter permease [Dyadobacter pollutisoli]WAC12623.1 ABC transporter permease [Dyadobacter pollutisoli]
MIRNYFKIAFRNLSRNKTYAGINIFGLAMGLATCLLIILYISDELSFDKHHKDPDRIFRVATSSKLEDWSAAAGPVAAGLQNDFPEVEAAARILKFPGVKKMLLKYRQGATEKQFYEPNGYYADSTLFDIFTYDFKYGNAKTALSSPNTLVLSETVAEKIFGNTDPIGKTIKIGLFFGDFDYTVTGVFKDNHKSHVDAHMLLSMQNNDLGGWVSQQKNWATNNLFHTYVKLKQGTSAQAFEAKLPAFMDRNAAVDLKALGITKKLFLQAVPDIYLTSAIGNELSLNGSMTYLYIFGSIAAFLLLIACINFMNLSTARSEKRVREVGVRKVLGAFKKSLVYQFLSESLMLSVFGLLLALVFIQLFLPVFNDLTGKQLSILQNTDFILWIVGVTLVTGLFAGLYPAFFLSSFKPVNVLKGRLVNSISVVAVRKGLVVFQFTISIILILGAVVIWQQLSFIQNQNLGFNKEQKIVIPLKSNQTADHFRVLRDEVLANPHVVSASSGSAHPGGETVDDLLFYTENKSMNEAVDIHFAAVGENYIETLGFTMVAGRPFSRSFSGDSSSIILNERAVKELGYNAKTAIGKNIYFELNNVRGRMQIVGVVKDFNFESLHERIKPYGLTTTISDKYRYLIANVKTTDYGVLIASIEKSWNKLNPGTPFSYSFMNQDFQQRYDKELRTSRIVIYFTFIAIIIASLGLFGLATFSAAQRTKEIGIRKVLGASVMSIAGMLSREFVVLVLIAIVIASPVAWYGMQLWLQDFAYKIEIKWWVFALSGLVALVVALLTVSYQSIKAALMNPVESLRSE